MQGNAFSGLFGLFTNIHFSNFFYMSLILGMGSLISYAIISKLFDRKIINYKFLMNEF